MKNTKKKPGSPNAPALRTITKRVLAMHTEGECCGDTIQLLGRRIPSVISRQMASFLHMLSCTVSLLSRLLDLAKPTSLPGVEAEDAVLGWHFIQLPLPLPLTTAQRAGLCPPGDCCPRQPDARVNSASCFLVLDGVHEPCFKQAHHMPLFSMSLESETRLPDCYLLNPVSATS